MRAKRTEYQVYTVDTDSNIDWQKDSVCLETAIRENLKADETQEALVKIIVALSEYGIIDPAQFLPANSYIVEEHR